MYGRETVVMNPDYLTGTVTCTTGSTTVTIAGGSVPSGDTLSSGQYFLQTSQANDWYQVTAGSGTSLTLSTAYQDPGGSGLTYTLRQFFYSLSSQADEIIDIRNWNTPIKLIQVDLRTIDTINPLAQSTNAPYGYMMFGYDISGNLQISPYPFTTDARLFEVRTKKRPVDMVNAGDYPSIPNKYAHIIAFGADAVAFAYRQQFDKAVPWEKKFEKRIMDMKKEYRQSEDMQGILGSIDSFSRSKWIQFPEQYPSINQ
jgi:hypothetical protein